MSQSPAWNPLVTGTTHSVPYYRCPQCMPGWSVGPLKTDTESTGAGASTFKFTFSQVPYSCPRGIDAHRKPQKQ